MELVKIKQSIDLMSNILVDMLPKEIIEYILIIYLFTIELRHKIDCDVLLSKGLFPRHDCGFICAKEKVYFCAVTSYYRDTYVYSLDTKTLKFEHVNEIVWLNKGMVQFDNEKILMSIDSSRLNDFDMSILININDKTNSDKYVKYHAEFHGRNDVNDMVYVVGVSPCKKYMFEYIGTFDGKRKYEGILKNEIDHQDEVLFYKTKDVDDTSNFRKSNDDFIALNNKEKYMSIIMRENKMVIITNNRFIFCSIEPYQQTHEFRIDKKYQIIAACQSAEYVFVLFAKKCQSDILTSDVAISVPFGNDDTIDTNNMFLNVYDLAKFLGWTFKSTQSCSHVDDALIESIKVNSKGEKKYGNYCNYNTERYFMAAEGNDLVICDNISFYIFNVL